MYEATASCKHIARAPVTNWEPRGVTLAGYCYAARHEMRVPLVTPYRVSRMWHYSITVRGNVKSVYPSLNVCPLLFKEDEHRPTMSIYIESCSGHSINLAYKSLYTKCLFCTWYFAWLPPHTVQTMLPLWWSLLQPNNYLHHTGTR